MSRPLSLYEEATMASFLGHHFEDGLVQVRSRDDRHLLKLAVRLGLVDGDRFLTASGHRFLRAHRPAVLSAAGAPPDPLAPRAT